MEKTIYRYSYIAYRLEKGAGSIRLSGDIVHETSHALTGVNDVKKLIGMQQGAMVSDIAITNIENIVTGEVIVYESVTSVPFSEEQKSITSNKKELTNIDAVIKMKSNSGKQNRKNCKGCKKKFLKENMIPIKKEVKGITNRVHDWYCESCCSLSENKRS